MLVHNGIIGIPHPIFMISEQYRIVTSNVNYPLKAKRTTLVVLFAERGVALWFGWIAQVGHDEARPGEHLALMPFHFGHHVAGQVPTVYPLSH
jgi:hypothetical protein